MELSGPVVNVLRLADGEIPSAGKIYVAMSQLGTKIQSVINSSNGSIPKAAAQEVRANVWCKVSFRNL